MVNKDLNSIVVILSNSIVFKITLSNYPLLAKAPQQKLNNWRAIGQGVGIHWPDLDEDLSLKDMTTEAVLDRFT